MSVTSRYWATLELGYQVWIYHRKSWLSGICNE